MKNKAFSLLEISVVVIIIGILISGISVGIDLYKDFKFSTARQLTQNSRVPRISGLTLWLETTQEKSFENANPKDGELIGVWKDINPYKKSDFIFSQVNNADKPIYVKSYLKNELPALKFNGTSSVLSKTSIRAGDLFESTFITAFVVNNSNGLGQQTSFAWISAANYRIQLAAPYDDTIFFDYRKEDTSSATRARIQVDNTTFYNKNVVFTLVRNNTYMGVSLNGNLLISKSDVTTTDNLNVNLIGDFNIGSGFGVGSSKFNGTISEVIIYNRQLNSKEIKEVHEYLAKKHGIKIS